MACTFHCVLGPWGIVCSSEWRISHQRTNPTVLPRRANALNPPPHCAWIKQAISAHGHLSEHQVIINQCKRVEQTNSAQTKLEFINSIAALCVAILLLAKLVLTAFLIEEPRSFPLERTTRSLFHLFSAILSCLSQSDTPPNTTFNLTSPDCATRSPSATRVLRTRPHHIDTL